MPIDVTPKHVFAYDGTNLQLVDEHTMVHVSGNVLQFTSTVTNSQHFLMRGRPRRIVAFDCNWKTSEIAITTRDAAPEIQFYSFPDKKLRHKCALPHLSAIEFSHLKFSRCGKRLLSVHQAKDSSQKTIVIWDTEICEPLKGCSDGFSIADVTFLSFDPSNVDQFVVGNDQGVYLYKIYKGKQSFLVRQVPIRLLASEVPDEEEKKSQFLSHVWTKNGRFFASNRHGDLLLMDSSTDSVIQVIECAQRPHKTPIVAMVSTVETLVVAYADGEVVWLGLHEHKDQLSCEMLQSATLPSSILRSTEDDSSLVTVMTTSPNYAKAYIGTRFGQVFELKTTVAIEEEEEENAASTEPVEAVETEATVVNGSHLVASIGSFHTGAVYASAPLTPSGGHLQTDGMVATGGADGQLYFWSIPKCRLMVETNVLALFASPGASTASANDLSAVVADASMAAGTDGSRQIVITAMAGRPADPLVVVGDQNGRLRALCASKEVGTGTIEILPLHSVQLLEFGTPIDLLELHPTQPAVVAASTHSRLAFLVSLDHEKHFEVLAYYQLESVQDHLVDVQWSVPKHSVSALSFTCFSSSGALTVARYAEEAVAHQDASASNDKPWRLRGKSIGFNSELVNKCTNVKFLSPAPTSLLLGLSPQTNDLQLIQCLDHGNVQATAAAAMSDQEHVKLLSKVLLQDAHDNGVSAIALFPKLLRQGEQLIATAGLNGTITLWVLTFHHHQHRELQLDDVQATKKKSLVPHAGPITSLFFLPLGDDLVLVSCGADGSVFVLDVRLSSEFRVMTTDQNDFSVMSPLYMSIVSFAKYDDRFQPSAEAETKPLLQVVAEEREVAARTRFDRLKDKTRAQLSDLETKLKSLLVENDQLPPSERLEREEFVINVEWRDHLIAQHKDRANKVRETLEKEMAKMAIVRQRMKAEFWETASVHGVKLRGLNQGSSVMVYNFPMRKTSKQDQVKMKKIELLRRIELEHQQAEISTDESFASRLNQTIATNIQWLMDAGLHHPSLHRWVKASTTNDLKPFTLLYHPAAIRTKRQQRLQIQLLQTYERFLLTEFNQEFDEMKKLKHVKIEEIEIKNARISEIANELSLAHAVDGLFKPKWQSDEVASSILEVSPEEMTQEVYETEDMKAKRAKEALERQELEKQRRKDDVAGRALDDMMNGTLETKKENLVTQTLVKEAWMVEIPVEEMSSEQRKLLLAFEAAQQKLNEEKEKYKKSLDLELKKIKLEILEICKAFDDKLKQLQDVYVTTKTSVLIQQLYALRLAEDVMEMEHLDAERRHLETKIQDLQAEIQKSEKENESFAAQVERCKDEWHHTVEEEKLLEKNFPRELEDMVAKSGITIEHDVMKQLIELFRKRKVEDFHAKHSTSGLLGTKKSKSSMSMSATSSKHRMLADGLPKETSSRQLTPAALLQSLANSETTMENEVNLDPFQSIDAQLQHQDTRHRRVTTLDYETDRPDGLFIDERVWKALNELRTRKILSEHVVREKQEQLTLAKSVLEELRIKLSQLQLLMQELTVRFEHLGRQLIALGENAPLLVHIKQGQDETSHEAVFKPSNDALLVARASVESLNDVIQLHGKDQVGILTKIKNFRKNINIMEWEHTLLQMQTRDMEERYTDIQLLRVTKDLQELFHTGDTSEKQKRELALLEAKLVHVGKQHQQNVLKIDKSMQKLEKQWRERVKENQSFVAQVQQLEMQVQIRQDILASRRSAALRSHDTKAQASGEMNGPSSGHEARLKAITVRRKLVDLAKAQTEEIEYLRMELDKMRRRTFPSFAQHVAARTYQGEH